jgi:hypothetical protein
MEVLNTDIKHLYPRASTKNSLQAKCPAPWSGVFCRRCKKFKRNGRESTSSAQFDAKKLAKSGVGVL